MSDAPSVGPVPPAPSPGGPFALVDLFSGRVYPLLPGPNSVGRAADNRIVLADSAVSRRHAVVMVHADGKCEVRDTDSQNGIWVNRRCVRVAELTSGDLFGLCDYRFLFTHSRAGSDPAGLSFWDERLGVVVWNGSDSCWHFRVALGQARFVLATHTPCSDAPPTADPDWDAVRACYRWIRDNELTVRDFIYAANRGSGSRYLCPRNLTHVLFARTGATLIYDDFRETTCVTIDQSGRILSAPIQIPNDADDN
jgi:hypothetical protein